MILQQPQVRNRDGDVFRREIVQVHQRGKTRETAYSVGTPARLRAPMPKPSDIFAVRIGPHPGVDQNLMAVATYKTVNTARDMMCNSCRSRHVCVSVTQRQGTKSRSSRDWITKLFRDLCDTHTCTTDLERTSVCKFGVGVGNVLGPKYRGGINKKNNSSSKKKRCKDVSVFSN